MLEWVKIEIEERPDKYWHWLSLFSYIGGVEENEKPLVVTFTSLPNMLATTPV